MKTRKIAMTLAACAAMGVAAPVASAQTASQEGYDESGVLGSVQSSGGGGGGDVVAASPDVAAAPSVPAAPSSSSESASGESLPFTGQDLGIVALLGGALLGTGLAVRRVARHPAA